MIPRSSNRPGDLDALAAGHAASHASSRVGGSRWPGHARFTREYPAMAGHHGLTRRGRRRASRQSAPAPRLGRYGISPSPSDYLASEQLT